jgi:hypothetical protein
MNHPVLRLKVITNGNADCFPGIRSDVISQLMPQMMKARAMSQLGAELCPDT